MRLQVSRASAEEQLVALLNEGYQLRQNLRLDYDSRRNAEVFDAVSDMQRYYGQVDAWGNKVNQTLQEVFPTALESNYFCSQASHPAVDYQGMDQKFGHLFYRTLPSYTKRLKRILEADLPHYTDLPIQDRLFIEDIDSFRKVRDINPAMVTGFLKNGFLNQTEDQVQLALEQILGVSFHRKDWAGEVNDLYTANVVVNGLRHPTGFLLKGPGIGKKEMTIADCGKNGDQIVRLFTTPADLFVVQYVGPIADMLVRDVQGKVAELRAQRREAHFLIMDGQDTARLLQAYGKL